MALKDIATNLENYKFGMSDPEQIDTQKAIGVDFFNNQEGGVIRGFTTNVVPGEHQTEYIKYYEGTPVAPRTHSGTFYADLNPITNRSSIYRDESGNYILPDTGVNTNPPGTQSGILKFTPPQITLNLEDGFSNEPFSISARPSDSPTLLDRITGLTSTTQYTDFTGLPWDFRAPKRIIQTATDNQPGITWTFENSPNQQFTETLDGTTHSSLVNTLLTFEPEGDLFGQFTKVPSGLNEQNQFGIDTFRNVANRGPHEGKNLHPIVLRPIPSNFEVNNEFTNLFGVPELSKTFVTISLIDKQRLQKVYDTDVERGEIIIGKQRQLQRFNTNINTRVLQPFSIIGMKNHFDQAGDEEKTPFYSPIRFSDKVTFTRTVQVRGPRDTYQDTGNDEFGMSEEDETETYEELVTNEVNFPDGAGQNSLGRLFKNKKLSTGALIDAYPNKYNNPEGVGEIKSSAPITIENGVPSFKDSSLSLALRDVNKISNVPGGNFNSSTNISNLERYATLSYGNLNKRFSYSRTLLSPSEKAEKDGSFENLESDPNVSNLFGLIDSDRARALEGIRVETVRDKMKGVGDQGSLRKRMVVKDTKLGIIKGNSQGTEGLVDKINMLRPLNPDDVDKDGDGLDIFGGDVKDFIKFRFYDVVGQKYIIMRAILSAITDNVTADYSEEKYMGRPDKLYVYKGADRDVGFTFKVYPKTKQEFPILIEKLNYILGLCYPTFTENNIMKTPYMQLTIGDMFVDAPGILKSVNVTVEDNTTWEIDHGLQFPKHINVACQFRYIGSHAPTTTARHYAGLTPHQVQNPTSEENFENILTQYLGNGPIVSGLLDLAEDPADFVEDAFESAVNTVTGWFR